jgi:hypothetical protein
MYLSGLIQLSVQFMLYILIISVKLILFSIFSVNIISLNQEVRGIFIIKVAGEMQNNLRFCD